MSDVRYDLEDTLNRLKIAGYLLYAVSEAVPEGKMIVMAETDIGYGGFLFHDEETAARIAAEQGMALMHLRDAPLKPFRIPMPNTIRLSAEDEHAMELRMNWRLTRGLR